LFYCVCCRCCSVPVGVVGVLWCLCRAVARVVIHGLQLWWCHVPLVAGVLWGFALETFLNPWVYGLLGW